MSPQQTSQFMGAPKEKPSPYTRPDRHEKIGKANVCAIDVMICPECGLSHNNVVLHLFVAREEGGPK